MRPVWSKESIPLITNTSVSMLYNNLSAAGDRLVFAHIDEPVLVRGCKTSVRPEAKKLKKSENNIFQVKICQIASKPYIAIANEEGFQLWDGDGDRILYQFSLSKEITPVPDILCFCRGIGYHEADMTSSILVGSSHGIIFVFTVDMATDAVSLRLQLQGHESPISAISDSRIHENDDDTSKDNSIIASADSTGCIFVWDAMDHFERLRIIKNNGYSITSIDLYNEEMIIATFITGHIKFYRVHSGNMVAEIAGHSRPINGSNIKDDLLATVGEDTFLNIWKLPDIINNHIHFSTFEIKLVHSQRIMDDLLTGVVILENGDIITAAYDKTILKKWKKT